MVESIGKRIAYLRQKNGWTQQTLADRLAMSRVAISHIEMDLTIPSERSITLIAGVFKLSPSDLVEETTYPRAKAERLPELTAIYTEIELNYILLQNDMEWLDRLDDPAVKRVCLLKVLEKWYPRLEKWSFRYTDEKETSILSQMRQILMELSDSMEVHLT
jgi:transcriptional regulator with XRE-family HTH domain